MTPKRICSDCVRILRREISLRKAANNGESLRRPFSSQPPRLQGPRLRDEPQGQQHDAAAESASEAAASTPSPPQPPPTTRPPLPGRLDGDALSDDMTSRSSLNGPSTAKMQQHLSSNLQNGSGLFPRFKFDQIASAYATSGSTSSQTYLVYGTTESLIQKFASYTSYTIPESQRQNVLTGNGPPKTASGEDLGQPDPPPSRPSTASESSSSLSSSSAGPMPREKRNWWFSELQLPPTFSTWSQVTYLHMYMYMVRLRALEQPNSRFTVAKYQQHLLDHFSHAAEDKMTLLHGMAARGVRNRYLKDLFLQYRGLVAAYDEGLVQGDAVLATAIWRNLWKAQEDVDWVKVGMVVGFVRRSVELLAAIPDRSILQGNVEVEVDQGNGYDHGGDGDGDGDHDGEWPEEVGQAGVSVFKFARQGLKRQVLAQADCKIQAPPEPEPESERERERDPPA